MNIYKWGTPQENEELADGAAMVSTASHGGIVLSEDRNALVPESAREPDGCYEEDCAWAKAWTALRAAKVIPDDVRTGGQDAFDLDAQAYKTVQDWYPDQVRDLTGDAPDPDGFIMRQRRDYADAREKGWVMSVGMVESTALNAVPEGMVGAVLAPVSDTEDATRRDERFFALIPEEIYGVSLLKSGLRPFEEGEFAVIGFDPFRPDPDSDPMSPEEAYEVASQWGSYMRDGDPGAVFYTFPTGDARPQSPDHRLTLISHTRTCQMIAASRALEADEDAEDDPNDDVEQLRRLEKFFATSEQVPRLEPETPDMEI